MFSRFFVRRPVFAWVIAILIMLAGMLAIRTLPVAQYRTWLRRRSKSPPPIPVPPHRRWKTA